MPSLNQHLRDVESAKEAVDTPAVRHALSTTKSAELRAFLERDSYAFTYIVCGHHDIVPEYHMPVSYAACGLSDLLAWSLTQSGFEGYLIDQFREACKLRDIDLRTAGGIAKLDAQLDWVNMCITRGAFKSSVVTHGGVTFTGTVDPNTTSKITTAVNDKAWELASQIGETILSGRYADIFPDRVPANPQKDVTESVIRFGGRTISHPQQTVNAFGYLVKDVGGHYDRFWDDDLVVGGPGGNNSPALLPGVWDLLSGRFGYEMITRRVRRVRVGTRWDERDDHVFLTTGNRAKACFSIVVPIETYEGEVVNILERGAPTLPKILPTQRIQKMQDSALASMSEVEAVQNWRCSALLDPGAAGGRLFSEKIINDPERQWLGPYKHPKARKQVAYKERFVVERIARDSQGRPVDKNDRPLVIAYRDPKGEVRYRRCEDWKERVKVLIFDPWRDLDRVMTLDPSWRQGGNNWAITAAGIDHQMVKFQLESQADETGMEGWMEALPEMDEIYQPRVIGFGAGAYQDEAVRAILRADPRTRKLFTKIVPIPELQVSKRARIRSFVAEPLGMYRWLLDPTELGQPTRDEMRMYRGDPNAIDGILDSMSMVDALLRIVKSPAQRKEAAERAERDRRTYREMIDPALGVPRVA